FRRWKFYPHEKVSCCSRSLQFAPKIDNRKWRIKETKENERQAVKFEEIERPRIRQKIQERSCLRFVEQKSVILVRQQIGRECDGEINFRPSKCAQNAARARAESVDQHQEDDSDNDPRMRDEETDETEVGKAITQIWSNNCLKRSADSPKVSHFKPAPIARPERDDDDRHCPIAQL